MLVWSGCADVRRSRFIDVQHTEPDFESFAAAFSDPKTFIPCDKKDSLPLFLPAEFPEPAFGPVRRCSQNVLRVHFLVVDIDKGSPAEFERPLSIIEQYGHVTYTSFSHDPDKQWKFRVLVKLSRPVDITEWRAFFPRALDFLELLALADLKCADAAHMYYAPGGEPSKYSYSVGAGRGLDVDSILATALPKGVAEATENEESRYIESLPEGERGEITQGLKDFTEGKLQMLVDAIYARPYPGSFYDLKSHAVFGLGRMCPHALDPKRLETMVKVAIRGRYRNAGVRDEELEALQSKSFEQVDKAIEDGMSRPWFPPKVNEIPIRPFTEFGLAERLIDRHQKDIRYEPNWGSWLKWAETHWERKAGDVLVQEAMKNTIRAIPEEADALYVDYWAKKQLHLSTSADANTSDEVKAKAEFEYEQAKESIEAILKFATKSETNQKVASSIRVARSFPTVLSNIGNFDKDKWLLNFENGTVDLVSGKLREHRREDFITRVAPHKYNEDATCPLFDHFLSECMLGNKEMVDFLWRALGYSAIGVTDEQKLFFLWGDGANGKSTFINTILELFGKFGNGYGFSANSTNLLTSKGGEQHPTWRMDFAGVRIVAANELEEGRTFAESNIKELTGSDPITGRRMREDNWTYQPEFTLWLSANHLPHVRGTDEGIWRRIVIIEWLANFQSIADKALPKRLLREAPGIWARIVREAIAWRRQGLTLPDQVVKATDNYRQEQDPLRDFMEKWCVEDRSCEVERGLLWAAYEEYCNDSRNRTFHERKRFYALVEKRFTLKTINGRRYFSGVRIKSVKERIDALPRSVLLAAQQQEKSN